tara:strand:+ start:441 stop:803 length:363 start_codon:yes stop_codon:yes gene_type:complete
MPSQRKRIGFLPSSEVQSIIDKICKHNRLSQSKVTGILVEEALNSRGVLQSSIEKLSYNFDCNNKDSLFIYNNKFNNENDNIEESFNLKDISITDEVKMINDFIEFKFFKNVMNKNNKYN